MLLMNLLQTHCNLALLQGLQKSASSSYPNYNFGQLDYNTMMVYGVVTRNNEVVHNSKLND